MHELLIRVDSEQADLIAGLLFELGVSGFEERDEPRARCFVLYAPSTAELDAIQAALGQRIAELPSLSSQLTYQRRELAPGAEDAWTAHLQPEWLTETIVIQPETTPLPPPPARAIRYVPRLAFGSGSHPTTRLAARGLASLLEAGPGGRLLDVGTGNGVLALLAVMTGARSALGLDVDPQALDAAVVNARLNALNDRVAFSSAPLADIQEHFEFTVANIDAPTLILLAPVLCARTSVALLVTGLLSEQRPEVEAAFRAAGMRVAAVRELDDWCLLELRPALASAGRLG